MNNIQIMTHDWLCCLTPDLHLWINNHPSTHSESITPEVNPCSINHLYEPTESITPEVNLCSINHLSAHSEFITPEVNLCSINHLSAHSEYITPEVNLCSINHLYEPSTPGPPIKSIRWTTEDNPIILFRTSTRCQEPGLLTGCSLCDEDGRCFCPDAQSLEAGMQIHWRS